MKVLLHICCGICAAGAIEQLISEGHSVSGYFYNPNIYPIEEYHRRLEAAVTVAKEFDIGFSEGIYEPEKWYDETKEYRDESEGGKRCEVCFSHRLNNTYIYMKDNGYDAFTTTLTTGPRKPAAVVNRIGRETGGDMFLERDFKKQDGFQKATRLAKELAIHRQDYCGCVYSIRT